MLAAVFGALATIGLSALVLTWLVWAESHTRPLRDPDSGCVPRPKRIDAITEINQIVLAAAHAREFQEARYARLLEMHRYQHGTCEADFLQSVVYDGTDHEEALHCIMRLKHQRSQDG
jgi:hypothetical protein